MSRVIISVDIVQWSEDLYEEQLVDRTRDACGGHVDIVIDFSANSRSVRRAMKCLPPVSQSLTFSSLRYRFQYTQLLYIYIYSKFLSGCFLCYYYSC